jgi:hypothetical protein
MRALYDVHLQYLLAKQPSLKLKTRFKQSLGIFPFAITLPGAMYDANTIKLDIYQGRDVS